MAQQISTHAAAAKAIRAELKRHGIKASVKARAYSMGSSVDVKVQQDLTPAAVQQVQSFCGRFQYGHFDGMTDSYDYSNVDRDLPQVKFVHVDVEYSDEIRAAAREWVDRIQGIPEHEREHYAWMALNGSWGDFWKGRKPRMTVEQLRAL